MTKLNWEYDNAECCEVAYHNGYRIRAEHDDSARNPFEENDGNWPIAVRSDGRTQFYDKAPGHSINSVLQRFNPEHLVHDQKAIAEILNAKDYDVSRYMDEETLPQDEDGTRIVPKWITDSDALFSWFEEALDGLYDSEKFEAYEELHKLLGIPVYRTTSRGYSQGDWAEVLVVATPEAAAQLMGDSYWAELRSPEHIEGLGDFRVGCKQYVSSWHDTIEAARAEYDKLVAEGWEKDLKSTAALYGYWAWGDVFGYVVEKDVNADAPAACNQCDNTLNDGSDVCDQCGGDFEDPEPEWEEIEDGSCWGYYGDDHAASGLEEAALECIPDEPVGSPDNVLEEV